jgi:heptosyltransferase-2
MLLTRDFDIVINPDASQRSCEIATAAKAAKHYGFGINPEGTVVALNEAAQRWLVMGACDPIKRSNVRTYQDIVHEICEVDATDQYIVLSLTKEEEQQKQALASALGIPPRNPLVGINTGAGARWDLKKWRLEGFVELIGRLLETSDVNVMLLGGKSEKTRNTEIRSRFGDRVCDPGAGDLRKFIQATELCDVVVTGDTLGLHIALGLRKHVVALFGPTSPHEIDLYGSGTKIVAPVECVSCYRRQCDRKPNCMDLIPVDSVLDAVHEQMEAICCGVLT